MLEKWLESHPLRALNTDGLLLFITRSLRLFAMVPLRCPGPVRRPAGFERGQNRLLLTLTLVGDTFISLWITTQQTPGRRRMLFWGLSHGRGGVLFALTGIFSFSFWRPSSGDQPRGNEVGPFLPIEQAALTQIVPGETRTQIFAWYNLLARWATALGSLCGGALANGRRKRGCRR